MKSMWMKAGAFGVATAALAGCGSNGDTTVTVQPKAGTLQGQEDGPLVCFEAGGGDQGAQQWIDANCGGAGGHYYYSGSDPNSSRCASCTMSNGGGGSGPSLSGSNGYPTNNSGGDTSPSGTPTGGSTPTSTPTPPAETTPPDPDKPKPQFVCDCCDGAGEDIRDADEAFNASCPGNGSAACAPLGDFPDAMAALAVDESVLGASATFHLMPNAPAVTTDYPIGFSTTVGTYWSHMDDGDSVRFFDALTTYKTGGPLGTIAGILPVPWAVTLAIEFVKEANSANVEGLAAAYTSSGSKEGLYVESQEVYQNDSETYEEATGDMSNTHFNYSIYLRGTGQLLGTVSGTMLSQAPGGHLGVTPVAGVSNFDLAPFFPAASSAATLKCQELIASQQPDPNCQFSSDPSCHKPPSQNLE